MHKMQPVNGRQGCRFYAFLFPQSFLAGGAHSTVARDYFMPITQSDRLLIYPITNKIETSREMIEEFLFIADIALKKGFGYEFEIQYHLSRLWLNLFEETKRFGLHGKGGRKAGVQEDRIKRMLQYIHEHYSGEPCRRNAPSNE